MRLERTILYKLYLGGSRVKLTSMQQGTFLGQHLEAFTSGVSPSKVPMPIYAARFIGHRGDLSLSPDG